MTSGIHRRTFTACALSAALGARAQAPGAAPGATLRIGGTGAGTGPLQQVAATAGNATIQFVPNLGTSGGLKALVAGAIDIAVAARRLGDEEKAQGLVEHEVFRTPMVWAVQEGVPLRRATLDELAGYYAARTVQWPGGQPVRLVLRPETDTDTRFLRSLGPAMAEAVAAAQARPGVRVATTDTDAAEALERIPGAFGVTTLGLLRAERRRVHVLDIDGVAPGTDTMASKRYPHAKSIYIVTRGAPAGPLAAAVQALAGRGAAPVLVSLGCQPAASA